MTFVNDFDDEVSKRTLDLFRAKKHSLTAAILSNVKARINLRSNLEVMSLTLNGVEIVRPSNPKRYLPVLICFKKEKNFEGKKIIPFINGDVEQAFYDGIQQFLQQEQILRFVAGEYERHGVCLEADSLNNAISSPSFRDAIEEIVGTAIEDLGLTAVVGSAVAGIVFGSELLPFDFGTGLLATAVIGVLISQAVLFKSRVIGGINKRINGAINQDLLKNLSSTLIWEIHNVLKEALVIGERHIGIQMKPVQQLDLGGKDVASASLPKTVFICYSHKDNEGSNPQHRWLDRFLEFVKPLVRQEDLWIWCDKDIKIGADWSGTIDSRLRDAKAAVLFVSASFLASDFIANREIPLLLKKARDGGLPIFQVLVSPCLDAEARFKYPDPDKGPNEFTLRSLQAANPPSRTLTEMTDAEQARVFVDLAKSLVEALKPQQGER
jgi:hypothetical protein